MAHEASWHKSCRDLFSNTKQGREQKRKQAKESENTNPLKARRSSSSGLSSKNRCFFCDESDSNLDLHVVSTFEVDRKVRNCAHLLNDGKLLAKLSAGDMVAIDAKYHTKCLVSLYNQARQLESASHKDTAYISREGMAFAELIGYVDYCRESPEVTVLKLADLAKMYAAKLVELG